MIKQNIFIFRNQRIHQLWLRIVKLTIEHSCLLIFAINIFLEKENVYSGSNELIVSQLLSNYVIFSLLYCNIEKLKNCFEELQLICKSEGIKACGRNFFEKWILLLLYENKYYLLKISLQLRRLMRHLIRRLLRR